MLKTTSMHDPAVRKSIVERARLISPDSKGLWGAMSAPEMIVHVTDALRMSTGDLPVALKNTPLRHPPLKQLILYVLPFPHSTPTSPELRKRVPAAIDAELRALEASINAFAARSAATDWPVHPSFGRLSRRDWGVLMYRHSDHHLRQFGL